MENHSHKEVKLTTQLITQIPLQRVLANSFGIIIEDAAGSAGVSNVPGIPTFNSSARFRIQFTQTEICHYFLRNDRKHTCSQNKNKCFC